MTSFLYTLKSLSLAFLLLLPVAGLAANDDSDDDEDKDLWIDLSLDEIAKELSNPVTGLATIDNVFEYRFYQGDLPAADDEQAYIYKFRPSLPIRLSNGKNLIFRATVPINGEQPIYAADEQYSPFLIRQIASTIPTDGTFDNRHGHTHLADISFDVAYGGVSDNGFISMYGIATVWPSSQDLSQSRDQVLIGPDLAFGKMTDWGVYGAQFTHLTRVSGEDEWDTNMTAIKIFFSYGLGNGWQVFSNPVIEYDWEADPDNELFLPLGAGISKTTNIGSMPIKLSFEIQKYIVSPDSIGPDWLFTFNFTPVFKNPWQK